MGQTPSKQPSVDFSWASVLTAAARKDSLVPSFSAESIWTHRQLPRHATLSRQLLRVRGPSLVLRKGVVLTSRPLAVLDVSGGCCRRPAYQRSVAAGFSTLPSFNDLGSEWAPLIREVDGYREFGSVFHCISARSAAYFHSVGDTAHRLMGSLELLRSNTSIRVLVNGPAMPSLLAALGVQPARALLWHGSFVPLAIKVSGELLIPDSLIPDGAERLGHENAHTAQRKRLRASIAAERDRSLADMSRVLVQTATNSSRERHNGAYVLVVRRELGGMKRNGIRASASEKPNRAILNEAQLVAHLRRAFAPVRVRIQPPEAMAIRRQAELWNGAALAIAPHGAGLTNLMFLPRRGIALELRAQGQKGRVYGDLGRAVARRHEECVYNGSDTANPQDWHRQGKTANVVLPPAWLFGCIKARMADVADGIFTRDSWRRIDAIIARARPQARADERALDAVKKC